MSIFVELQKTLLGDLEKKKLTLTVPEGEIQSTDLWAYIPVLNVYRYHENEAMFFQKRKYAQEASKHKHVKTYSHTVASWSPLVPFCFPSLLCLVTPCFPSPLCLGPDIRTWQKVN